MSIKKCVVRPSAWGVAALGAAVLISATAGPAAANQPKQGPFAPTTTDGGQTLEAWADMTGECPGDAYRCDTYLKVERLVGTSWWGQEHWEDVAGKWISRQEGWVKVSASLPEGCATYRTKVLDYVLVPAEDGALELGFRGAVTAVIPVDGGTKYLEFTYGPSTAQLCGQRLGNDPQF